MAAYPGFAISRESVAEPDGGILTDLADDLTIRQRRVTAGTRYNLTIVEEWITGAQFAALLAAYDASLGPYDVPLHGQTYQANFTEEPAVIERSGALLRVQLTMVGVRV